MFSAPASDFQFSQHRSPLPLFHLPVIFYNSCFPGRGGTRLFVCRFVPTQSFVLRTYPSPNPLASAGWMATPSMPICPTIHCGNCQRMTQDVRTYHVWHTS